MHYRNGREAKNGDQVIQLSSTGAKVVSWGVLHSAVPGNDFCNGGVAPLPGNAYACLCDCLHVADVENLLAGVGLDKRPEGKN